MYDSVLLVILFLCLVTSYIAFIELYPFETPKALAVVGFRDEILSRCRASFRQILGSSETLTEGYEKHGTHGRPFVVPDTTFGPQIMLPRAFVKWLIRQPEGILSLDAIREERNAICYLPTCLDPKATLLFIDKVIGKALTRNLSLIHIDMYDEIRQSVDAILGKDVETWREVVVSQAMSTVVNRTASRVLFGTSLSHDKAYLRALRFFIVCMGASTLVVGQLPPYVLRPMIGILLFIPCWISKTLMASFVRPLVKERLRQATENHDQRESLTSQHDFISQSVIMASKPGLNIDTDMATFITEQFLFLGFAGMATTGAAATNLFLDLVSPGFVPNLQHVLRQEVAETFSSPSDWICAEKLKSLNVIDSTIRESLRQNNLQLKGLLRKVVPREGVILPDGTHVARGIWIGVPVDAMQRYCHPDARELTQLRSLVTKDETGKKHSEQNISAAQPSDEYLSFSYGRSTCPGRFFAITLLKVLFGYIITHYDIEPLSRRPSNISFGDASVPSVTASVRVRRRTVRTV